MRVRNVPCRDIRSLQIALLGSRLVRWGHIREIYGETFFLSIAIIFLFCLEWKSDCTLLVHTCPLTIEVLLLHLACEQLNRKRGPCRSLHAV